MKFGVLGAGVIGLTTGLELQRQFPNAEVCIIADKFNRETTSDGAAGIFRPGTSFSTNPEESVKFIIEESYRFYDDIVKSVDPLISGVSLVSGYIFSSNSPSLVRNELIENIVPLYRPATENELKLCSGNWKYGSYFITILTECRRYLPWCLERFQENKGKVIVKKIESRENLKEHNLDVAFNCLGFGSKKVFNDRKLVPIRGQVIKVSAPWLKNFFYADYDTYIIPGFENVTLGGCRDYDSYDVSFNRYLSAAIWERCTKLIPSLSNCSPEKEWVGLRPHRDPVRIELETLEIDNKFVKCIHNYGHGGYGVTTAPGSAKLAVKIAIDNLKGNSKL